MSGRLTREAYAKLIEEDIKWLESCPRTLERDHILLILKDAVRDEYDVPERGKEHSMDVKTRAALDLLDGVAHDGRNWGRVVERRNISTALAYIEKVEEERKKIILRCIEGFEAIRDSNLERGHQAADEMLKILRGKLNEP